MDWLPSVAVDGLPGRMGLTFLPGKHGASERYPGRIYRRELQRDLETLVTTGIRHLVLLVTDAELERWGDPAIVARGSAAGITVDRWPMDDGSAPSTLNEMRAIVGAIREARARGGVAVACMGGVGRTGTVAACILVDQGMGPSEAIAEVRRVRHPTAVETDAQVAFVHAYWRDRTAALRSGSDTVSA